MAEMLNRFYRHYAKETAITVDLANNTPAGKRNGRYTMKTYEFELIVDGKLLSRFWTNKADGKDAKFVANCLLNDRNRWTAMEYEKGDYWTKQTADNKTCYLDLVSVGIPKE